jgi:galactokinase
MAESHRSLRSDYEVSSEELDLMVLLANEQKGTVGARMTGGGFGGCTVNLVRNYAVEQFRSSVAQAYAARTGTKPEIYVSSAADGAAELL